mmetsp:Transcript_23409/g.34736  ORF Transcript_23409/g.34736 Transcript_23409/m.34736 type:complete len:678 (+) Transcript_23409:198-2231(+)
MHSASEEIAIDNNNKMTSSSNNNNKSVRVLKMKFKVPQNIDASYATMYDEDEEEDAHYADEMKYDDEENHNDEEDDEEEDILGEQDEADITIEEALPPPPTLIEEGGTAAEEIIIDKEVEGGNNELDTSSNNSNDAADTEFKYVQGMPSSSESWPERVNNFNGPRDNTKTATTSSVLPQQQQILNQKQYAMAQFDPNENELEVIDTTLIAQEQEDDIEEETVLVEGERQDGEEDEREDDEEVEVEDDEDKEEIEKEVDDQEEEGDDEEIVEEEGDEEEEMVEGEVEEEGDKEEQQHEQEEAPEGEEGENQQQQQDIEEVEAAKSNSHADILPSALDSWCKISRWHANEEFTHCSNSMDIPQAAVEDETFRKMYFFQTLVECCQKFFYADECENEDVCPNLDAVEEVGEIDVERQADGELEDEVPENEGQSEDGIDESEEDEEVAEEEEEVANEEEEEEEVAKEEEEEEEVTNEEEEEEDASDESNNKSSSTEGQGVQIDEANEKTNWEGFDEDMSHQDVKNEPEQPSSSSIEAHDLSEAQGKDDYEGDGFGVMKYKLLRGKGEGGKSSANPFTTIGSGALVAAFLLLLSCCLCCLRYRRRRYAQSKRPSRGNYAALGRHDFFNGTFSDDVSYGKDSDDDISIESYGSDDGGHQTNLEMGGFHEFDANGGLTLEEING